MMLRARCGYLANSVRRVANLGVMPSNDALQPPDQSGSNKKSEVEGDYKRYVDKQYIDNSYLIHSDWALSGKPGTGADHPSFRKIDLSFENIKEAYRSKSNFELLRAILVFRLCSFEKLITHQRPLLNLAERVLGRRILEKLLQLTFYGHFVAGADVETIKPVIQRMHRYGVKSILDYSVEEDVSAAERKVDPTPPPDEQQQQQQQVLATQNSESTSLIRKYRSEVPNLGEGVVSARTFYYEGEEACDRNAENFIKCIDAVADTTQGSGFAAVKVTALGKPELLMHISEVLVRIENCFNQLSDDGANTQLVSKRLSEYQLRKGLNRLGIPISRDDSQQWFTWMDKSKEGTIDLFEWSNLLNVNIRKVFSLPSLKTYTDSLGRQINLLQPMIAQLDPDTDFQFRNMVARLNRIVKHAKNKNVRLMIDAEQTYLQPAINRLAMEMMREFNKDAPVVFNTYQCYLRSSLQRAAMDIALSDREGFYFGCKLVRGAYMEQERERSEVLNYDDPIWANTDETTECFVKVFELLLKHAKTRPKGKVGVMLATHNEESVRLAVLKMKELGINPDDKIVCFGQLMGMCDQVSFSLGQAGFSTYKYIPYGPTFEVLPYLMRRAQENRSVFDKVTKERRLLTSELRRRLLRGQFIHRPK